MSGEILRSLLTERCGSRKLKTYTVEFNTGSTVATAITSQMLQILDGTYFLWMGTNLDQFAGATSPPSRTYTFDITRTRDQKSYQRIMAPARSVAGLSFAANWDNGTGGYSLLTGEDLLNVRFTLGNTNSQNSVFWLTLSGIEYRL